MHLSRLFIILPIITFATFSSEIIIEKPVYIIDSVKVPAYATPPDTGNVARVKNLPQIGKWMYQDDIVKAHWLGVQWNGKVLIEPINVIFIDSLSHSRDESVGALIANLNAAGYSDRVHHSSGYLGFIGNFFYPQLPVERHHAFSDNVAEVENNHGRIFGPHCIDGKFIYTGAFSRETIDLKAKIEHCFGSFNRARDELSQSLDKRSAYEISSFVNLRNTLLGNPDSTTAEHDGTAVVLRLKQLPQLKPEK